MSLSSASARLRALSPNMRGILAMLGAMALFAISDTFIKMAAERLPTSQIMVLRGFVSIAVLGVWLHLSVGLAALSQALHPLIFLRSGLEGVTAVLYITALSSIGLAEAFSIIQAAPLVVAALSVPLLGQHVGWRRWLAILTGFAGIILVVRPSPEGVNIMALLALAAAFTSALRDIVTRMLDVRIASVTITFITVLASFVFGLALSPFESWQQPGASELAYVAVAGAVIVGGNWCMVAAFRESDMATVSPFRYSNIVWGLLLGYAIWGDIPDGLAIVGTTLIIGAGIYTLHREALQRRRQVRSNAA